MVFEEVLRIPAGKTHPKKKLKPYGKYEYGCLGNWYIKVIIYKRFLCSN